MPASAIDRMLLSVSRAVDDPRVLRAMREVPRDRFVPPAARRYAYEDIALSIGAGQTISQPTIVGMMTAALALEGSERVLEVGTGSGYQAAVLARLAAEVVTVEVVDELRDRAASVLAELGMTNVTVLPAGETLGAPERGPFDAIAVTAAAPAVPPPLLDQLAPGGRIVIPVGSREAQELMLVTREGGTVRWRSLGDCRFVPLTGPHGFPGAGH